MSSGGAAAMLPGAHQAYSAFPWRADVVKDRSRASHPLEARS